MMAVCDLTKSVPTPRKVAQGGISPPPRIQRVLVLSVVLMGSVLDGSARAQIRPEPEPDRSVSQQLTVPHFDYGGLIHVHSDYSADATGSYESLAGVASAQGLRFVVVTDHNTLQPLIDHRQGLSAGVLMLTGMESSRPEGHLLALDSATAPVDQATPTDSFLSVVSGEGGLVIVAHPLHHRWAWRGAIDSRMDGMEILDLADSFDAASFRCKAAALAMLPFDRTAAYLELAVHPDASLRLWDTIGQSRRFVGIYSPDLHQSIALGSGRRIAFPPAAEIMRIARDHIVSVAPLQGQFENDKSVVYDAIREGHLFVAVDLLADATGFMFTAAQSDRLAWMGDEISAGRPTTYSIVLPPTAGPLRPVIRLLRNGVSIAQSRPGADALNVVDARDGVFRVEVVTKAPTPFGRAREMTWIYSNPIYARNGVAGLAASNP